ncbi:MAG TPA: hypothetical protein VL022_01920 [Moheibacter sp.]|nr:hypothetical protein [Moheibacter sp.]
MKNLVYWMVATFLLYSCDKTTENTVDNPINNDEISVETTADDVAGFDWLTLIFECEDPTQFCFPNEYEVCTERFMEFLIEGNQIYGASPLSEKEKVTAKQLYQKKWNGIYPLQTEEVWPFGRGNGDVTHLNNVVIEKLGGLTYSVFVTYEPGYATQNTVKLVPNGDAFLIDFIETHDEKNNASQNSEQATHEFTQKWTWAYHNNLIEEGEYGRNGEFSVYYNESNRNWLFTKEAYGQTGDMVNWVIGQADGNYLFSYMGEFPGEAASIERLYESTENPFALKDLYKDLNQTKSFDIQGKVYTGQLYETVYEKNTLDHGRLYLTKTPTDFTALYFFNSVNSETKIPYQFGHMPSNYLILEERAVVMGEKVELQFLGVSKVKKTVTF